MGDAKVIIFRLRTSDGEYRTPDRSNCAIVAGYDAYKTGGNNIPLVPVPLFGDLPEDKYAEVIANREAFMNANYGFLLAASKTE